MQNNDLEQKIAALPFESMKELKGLWQSYFNKPSPDITKLKQAHMKLREMGNILGIETQALEI